MKSFIYIAVLFTQILFAQSKAEAKKLFEEGNDLYQKEQFEQAAAKYEQVLKEGLVSDEVYFNLGNSYYKLNKVALSVYNFEKAKQLNPTCSSVENNLHFSRQLAVDEFDVVPRVGMDKLIFDTTSIFHYNSWAWIGVGMAFLFFLAFAGYYYSNYNITKRLFFSGMVVLLVLMTLALLSANFQKKYRDSNKSAIVFDTVISVRSEPKETSPEITPIHEGAKVLIIEDVNGWNKVALPNGVQGWLPKTAIRKL